MVKDIADIIRERRMPHLIEEEKEVSDNKNLVGRRIRGNYE